MQAGRLPHRQPSPDDGGVAGSTGDGGRAPRRRPPPPSCAPIHGNASEGRRERRICPAGLERRPVGVMYVAVRDEWCFYRGFC